MIDLMVVASAGLVQLALSGSPNLLQTELLAKGITTTIITRDDFSAAAGGRNPTSDLFIKDDCHGAAPEYLAPQGLQLPDGSKWAMFEPCRYPDHFIIEYADGALERWDVGRRPEGDDIPYQVEVVGTMVVRLAKSPSPASSGGGGGGAGLVVGGIAAAGIGLYLFSGGTPDDISWTPQYAFLYDGDGAARYSYGSRWEYQKDNWRAHWTVHRTDESEYWRYGADMQWTAGVWTASFGGESFVDKSELELSLTARRTFGGWTLQSDAKVDAHVDEFSAVFSRRISAAAIRRIAKWTFSATATAQDRDGESSANVGVVLTREL